MLAGDCDSFTTTKNDFKCQFKHLNNTTIHYYSEFIKVIQNSNVI
jgi:hypothetical protein